MNVVKVSTETQLQDAYNIRNKVFVEEQKVPYELEIDEFEPHSDHFVLYSEGTPIGAGRFRVLDGKGKIERICVLSLNRGSGAGKIIMGAIEDHAKESGIVILKLNAQTYAIPFYEKLGYTVVSDEFLDAGIPHKTMEKIIT
ncbi:GNAT family N-acetyltransferase [Bacillus sp. FJAT-49732]|uniref:GNAT family N-acetyltransferase n=1 Tax=Lederbergia citrisecunda TaxID=2833583 RepID=A0A942YJL0_9BACI|nr:GNAT family N-acetyltransferase [Lederbergia citrisecunda]MBS4198707.1 GNAT family N-acetyltransferase [Lederbergia citrisecunda]